MQQNQSLIGGKSLHQFQQIFCKYHDICYCVCIGTIRCPPTMHQNFLQNGGQPFLATNYFCQPPFCVRRDCQLLGNGWNVDARIKSGILTKSYFEYTRYAIRRIREKPTGKNVSVTETAAPRNIKIGQSPSGPEQETNCVDETVRTTGIITKKAAQHIQPSGPIAMKGV